MSGLKKAILLLLTILMVNLTFYEEVEAYHLKIDNWTMIDEQGGFELWQRKELDFISENIIDLSAPLGSEILKGYTINLKKESSFSNISIDHYPLGFWKITYLGFDMAGNIYLKLFTKRKNLSEEDEERLYQLLKTEMSKDIFKEPDIIIKRDLLFKNNLEEFLDKEGEEIVVNPEKTLIIFEQSALPGLKIKILSANSLINLKVASLDK